MKFCIPVISIDNMRGMNRKLAVRIVPMLISKDFEDYTMQWTVMTTKNYRKTDKSINSQPEMFKSGNKNEKRKQLHGHTTKRDSLRDIDMTANRRKHYAMKQLYEGYDKQDTTK